MAALIRYRPYSLLKELQNEMNRLYSDSWPTEQDEGVMATHWSPAVDVKEEENRFIVLADIPGVDPKNIKVRMDENGVLTVSGEKVSESKKEEKGYSRIERFSGSFYRRFTLPDTADSHGISAKSKHGVLEIAIPKKAKAQPKSIEVKVEE